MPSPTRATTVSSVAPPMKRSRLVRTVTRARTRSEMPSLATASIFPPRPMSGCGQSMTLGLMLVRTASSTVFEVPLQARSMAQARLKSRGMPALSAAIRDSTTCETSPPARKWASSWSVLIGMPAFDAVMRVSTMSALGTPRRYMARRLTMLTGALEMLARSQRLKNLATIRKMISASTMAPPTKKSCRLGMRLMDGGLGFMKADARADFRARCR